jgi:predicted secreted Zn-dependent protease
MAWSGRGTQRGAETVAGLTWRKASSCAAGECVLVAESDGLIFLSNAPTPAETVCCSASAWQDFVAAVKVGEVPGC